MGINKMLQAGAEEQSSKITKAGEKKPAKTAAAVAQKKSVKKSGGRPPLPEGQARKQYTITLPEEKYKAALSAAKEEGISFARYVERALDSYV